MPNGILPFSEFEPYYGPLSEDVDKVALMQMLTSNGFQTKETTVKKRIAVVSDTRSATMTDVIAKIKEILDIDVTIDKTPASRKISSIGIIKISKTLEIVVKPLSKNVLKAEQEATSALVKLIKEAVQQTGSPISINIGNKKIYNVVSAGADQIKGDPKADIALINKKGKEVGFISHKKEGGASAFQQYGGISKAAGQKIYTNSLVIKFVEALEKHTGGSGKSGLSAYRYIPNTREGQKLVGMSVFGPEYNGGRSFNRQSVHCIGQGSPILTTQGDIGLFTLTFSEATHTPDSVLWAFNGSYAAIFGATYRAGRKIDSSDIRISNMRGGIYPYDFISGRKATEI